MACRGASLALSPFLMPNPLGHARALTPVHPAGAARVTRRFSLRAGLAAALWTAGATARAQTTEPAALTRLDLLLLQPSAVMEARVPDLDAMAAYIRAVEAAAREGAQASALHQATGGFLVLAVRPGRASRAWLDMDTLLDAGLRQQLLGRVQAVPAFEVREGPVVFALKFTTWGGRPPRRLVPSPPEWRAARGDGPAPEVSELALRAWDAASGAAH